MSTISVIIPVFKAEKQIRRCLDSLLGQTFSDWEAICVDDGSPDACGEILDCYAASDPRFKPVHKSNEGVGKARNIAVERASGEWLMYMDADDFLHPQAMEICLSLARRDHSDMVTYTYNRRYRTLISILQMLHLPEPGRTCFKHYETDRLEALRVTDIFDWATEYSHPHKGKDSRWVTKHCQPWRAFVRKERTAGIKFPEGIIYEDFPWWSGVLLNVRSTTLTDLPLYYYYPNFSGYILSTSQQKRIESLEKAIKVADEIMKDADSEQLHRWQVQFRAPFAAKLEAKKKRRAEMREVPKAH